MVLAIGFETDVAQHDNLVVALDLLEGPAQGFARILVVTREEFLVGAHDAIGRAHQTFTVGIVAGPANERAHRVLGVGARWPIGLRQAGGRLGLGALPDCDNLSHLLLEGLPAPLIRAGQMLLRRFWRVLKS